MEERWSYGAAEIRLLETTADLGLAVRAPTLGSLLAGAGYGFTALTTDPALLEPRWPRLMTLTTPGRPELLVHWIEALIVLFETESFLARELQVRIKNRTLRARLIGDLFDPDRHPLYAQVKGATYHRLSLTGPRPWRGEVILDV